MAPVQDPHAIALFAVWIAFALCFFVLRPRGSEGSVKKRDARARVGIVLQAVAFVLAWGAHAGPRRWTGPWAESLGWTGVAIGVLAVALACWSVHTLGKQWAVQAQIVEGHALVTTGPYARIRNPIYTAMLGMFLATVLNFGTPLALVSGLVLFLAGTRIRTNREEQLLRGEFGPAFEEWRRRAGWLLP